MNELIEKAIQIGLDVLTKHDVEINEETMKLVKEAAQGFIAIIDGAAKKKAEAAGDAAAAAVTTEEQAEAEQRKP